MSSKEFEIKPIRLSLKGDDTATASVTSTKDRDTLHARFSALAKLIGDADRQRQPGRTTAEFSATALAALVQDFLALTETLDAQYGPDAELPIVDAADAADEALRSLAELQTWLTRFDLAGREVDLQAVVIGVGYWAMRHRLAINVVEPIVNALAVRANEAASRQESAAAYALTQGFIAHFKPTLEADLERSNPERPWRLLNLNFAITAIRTGDPDMMRFAFDTLNANLPDECAGFYAEAHALACQPGFPAEPGGIIQAEYARWTRTH